MRRTEQEFKAEILRRSSAYRQRRKKRLKNTLVSLGCFAVLIFGIQLLPAGFGGATEGAADPMEEMKIDQLAPEIMEDITIDQMAPESAEGGVPEEPAANASNSYLYGDITGTVSVKVHTQPESEDYGQVFTDEKQIAAIEQVINAFRIHGTNPVENPGDAEGMAYVITVTNAEGEMSFTLFNNALYSEPDGCWYSSPECYRALLELILQEPNE